MSERFQKIVTSTLSADYVGNDWFDEFPNLRFATDIVKRNEILAKMLEQHCHSYIFGSAQQPPLASSSSTEGSENGDMSEEKIAVRFHKEPGCFEELLFGEDTIACSTPEDIFVWLSKVYETSRDFELGTFGGSLLAITMKTQSSKWEPIAIGYIKDVIGMAH